MTDPKHTTEPKTDFGFRDVPRHAKQGMVGEIFARVAPRYDLMNDLMSAGLHRLWKARLIDALYLPAKSPNQLHLLDVAGGTGDIALGAARRARALNAPLDITLIDINEDMLARAKTRLARAEASSTKKIDCLAANAEALPQASDSADFYTIAFGIRNITERQRALNEAHRVLRVGGRFVCLEFSQLTSARAQRLYDAYSFGVIPPLGALITGERAPYDYLVQSIRRFPSAPDFAREIEEAGFARVGYQSLSGGIAALHYGWKL